MLFLGFEILKLDFIIEDIGTSEKIPALTNIYRLENVTVSKVGF